MIEIRQLKADDWPWWREVRLRALELSPEAFGATLAEWSGAGDSEERWRDRLTHVPTNLIAVMAGLPIGQASGTAIDDGGRVELISMWVAPEARGQGAGDALIGAVVAWAESQSATEVVLAVKRTNEQAIALYERNGFEHRDQPPTADGASGLSDDEQQMVRPLSG